MRQSQHGKKPRGRGRKQHNPLSRVYESNGPDVKIRGSASHVADKYLSLARDAHSSGDRIAAENYYQHAEHYLRLIAAAQAQANAAAQQANERASNEETGDEQAAQSAGSDGEQPAPQAQSGQGEQRSRRGGRRRNGARPDQNGADQNGAANGAGATDAAEASDEKPEVVAADDAAPANGVSDAVNGTSEGEAGSLIESIDASSDAPDTPQPSSDPLNV